jgi:NTE family protein
MSNGQSKKKYRILCLGGGAPNLTLMSGALHALHPYFDEKEDNNVNILTMAGAGAVVGLHYLAPKGLKTKDPMEALENTINFGVSDSIYEMFPVNYKVFTKSGPSADLFYDHWHALPEVKAAIEQSGMSEEELLLSDWLLFQGAMMCPTDVNFYSLGLCAHPRFIEGLIDFDAINAIDPNVLQIEINAFSIEDQKIVDFTNYQVNEDNEEIKVDGRLLPQAITPDHLRAALSYPFLYPPFKIGDKHYYEGAAYQCLNQYSVKEVGQIDWVVFLDPLRSNMIGIPRNLWEAFAVSILLPTAGLSELGKLLIEDKNGSGYSLRDMKDKGEDENRRLSVLDFLLRVKEQLYFSDFHIPKDEVPMAWGWSRSSMKRLFERGQEAGRQIVERLRKDEEERRKD